MTYDASAPPPRQIRRRHEANDPAKLKVVQVGIRRKMRMWKREFIDKWNAQARGFVIANSGKNRRLGHDFQMRDEDDPERGEPTPWLRGVFGVCVFRTLSGARYPRSRGLRPNRCRRPVADRAPRPDHKSRNSCGARPR